MNINNELQWGIEMEKEGWKIYGGTLKKNIEERINQIPPWMNIFIETGSEIVFIWIKE